MIGAMTIITTFMSPYVIKFGFKFAERWKKIPGDEDKTMATDTEEKYDYLDSLIFSFSQKDV